MRKLKSLILMSLFTFTLLFSTTAFAADVFKFDPVTYTEGENVTVKLYIQDTSLTKIKWFGGIGVWYDSSVFEYVSGETKQSDGAIYAVAGGYPDQVVWSNETGDVTVEHDKAIMELKFAVKAGQEANVAGKKFKVDADNTMFTNPDTNTDYEFNVAEVEVTIPTPAVPSVTKGTEAGSVTEYTFENSTAMEGKKVLMTTAATAGNTITEDTRFYVSYQGGTERIFGRDIWSKLAQGGGSITVENVKFGIIVDEGLSASDFTFNVR